MPARWALERRDWKAAAALPTESPRRQSRTPTRSPTSRARSARRTPARCDDARASIAALARFSDGLAKAKEAYWAEQVAIQHDGAAAFLLLAEGRRDDAVAAMRAAAVREDATEKNAVTPGPIAPARELLGEMLLELKQPAAALKEFQATLKKEPNRFRAIYGAAVSAELSGDRATSRSYYAQLVKMCARADQPERPELQAAKQKLTAAPTVAFKVIGYYADWTASRYPLAEHSRRSADARELRLREDRRDDRLTWNAAAATEHGVPGRLRRSRLSARAVQSNHVAEADVSAPEVPDVGGRLDGFRSVLRDGRR